MHAQPHISLSQGQYASIQAALGAFALDGVMTGARVRDLEAENERLREMATLSQMEVQRQEEFVTHWQGETTLMHERLMAAQKEANDLLTRLQAVSGRIKVAATRIKAATASPTPRTRKAPAK